MQTLIVTGVRTKEFEKDSKGNIKLDTNGQAILSDKDLINKNGHKYKVFEFSTPRLVYTRTSDGSMKAIKRPIVSVGGYTAAEVSALPSKKGGPDDAYDFEVMEEVQGSIVKRKVEEYEVAGKKVNSASVVSLADSDDATAFELDVIQRFKSKGHTIMDMTPDEAKIANGALAGDLTPVDKDLAKTK